MTRWLASIAVVSLLCSSAAAAGSAKCPAALDSYQRPLMGDQPVHLSKAFRGQVVLVVNTASKCAYSPQYEGLEEIYARFVVLSPGKLLEACVHGLQWCGRIVVQQVVAEFPPGDFA
jgi:hypothetical protein